MSDNENIQPQGGEPDDEPREVTIVTDEGGVRIFSFQPTAAQRVAAALSDFVFAEPAPQADSGALDAAIAVWLTKITEAAESSDQQQGEGLKWEPMEDLGVKLTPWDTATAEGIQERAEAHAAGIREIQAAEGAIKGERFLRSIPHGEWLAGQAQKHAEEQAGLAEKNNRERSAGQSI